MFNFSTYHPNSFKDLSQLSTSFWMNKFLDAGCCLSHWRTVDCNFSIRCKFLPTLHFLHWHKKMIVTGAWMAFVLSPLVYADQTDVSFADEFSNIKEWSKQNRITINVSKTKEIVFHRPNPHRFHAPAPLQDVQQVPSCRLGTVIYYRLTLVVLTHCFARPTGGSLQTVPLL